MDADAVVSSRRPPVVTSSASAPAALNASTLAVLVEAGDGSPKPAEAVVRACAEVGVDVGLLLAAEDVKADAGSVVVVPLARADVPARLLVVGVGEGRPADWRAAGATTARRANGRRAAVVGMPERDCVSSSTAAAAARAFGEGIAFGAYKQPTRFAAASSASDGTADTGGDGTAGGGTADTGEPAPSGSSEKASLREVVLVTPDAGTPELVAALGAADVVGRAVYLARDLINTPADVATPAWLAARAVELAAEAGLGVRVLGPAELADGGFGGLIGVGQGSVYPPRLVQLSYEGPAPAGGAGAYGAGAYGAGANASVPGHRVLVGKGITFDSGGLSLKPTTSMVGMKTDMAGTAAVLATMTALAGLGAPGRVTGLLCLAENAIGAASMRPGDVISCYGGTTVEVLNTDAEGRLVLADGLAYAVANLAPDALVDLATLTGAISIALGRRTAGLFASDDALAEALTAASERAGERVWRLPLVEEYLPAIRSPVADLANIGRYLDVSGGSITAALFLREFAGGVPWVHFDIAGCGRSDSDDGELSKGGTGWGVRTLLCWLAASA